MKESNNISSSVPKTSLIRLPMYLNYLITRLNDGLVNISSTIIAEDLRLNHVQVRKDLAMTGVVGKPKTGFYVKELISNLKSFLGYDNTNDAILVGVGQLGNTLLSYDGFTNYGLNILAGFDVDKNIIGTVVNGKQIFSMDKMKNLCGRLKVHIGIITVPAQEAQKVCDVLVECGVLAIWNFAPTHLKAPENIIIQAENMAASLAVLSNKLTNRIANIGE